MPKPKWLEKVNTAYVVLGFMVLLAGVASPFVVKLDNRWANAEEEIQNNKDLKQSIELQQQTIENVNTKLSIEIARLTFEIRKEDFNNFVIKYGDKIETMTVENKIQFLSLKDKLDSAKTKYESLL